MDSAGGVGAVTEAVVRRPGPGFAGEAFGVASRTETLMGPRSFLGESTNCKSLNYSLFLFRIREYLPFFSNF